MPMTASAVVNRGELADAAGVLSAKDDVVGQGHRRADELVAEACDEQQRLASESEVLQHARGQADAELASARREADALPPFLER